MRNRKEEKKGNVMNNNWLQSVYSDSTENFVSNPCPRKGENITIRLQMTENEEIREVILRTREFGIENRIPMKLISTERGLKIYEAEVRVNDARFHYQFYLVTESAIYYYTQYRITDYIPDETRDFVILADYEGPSWVREAVFYQIFPDRFYNGNSATNVREGEYFYQGHLAKEVSDWNTPSMEYEEGFGMDFHNGDLEGIIQKMDYLQDLGINAIYLNPIFTSPSVHKYDSIDYFEIDPHLGGDAALKKLTEEAHKRGIHVMLDISINHTSSAAKWFNKENEFYGSEEGAFQNKDSELRDFYFFDENNDYDTWCGYKTMPKLNYSSQKLRDVIFREERSVLKKWVKAPYNIDGWRFDVADCLARNQEVDVHREVLKEIRANLKAEKSDLYLLAEDWADCSEDLQGDSWDSTMNYFGCTRPVRNFIGDCDLFHARDEILRKMDSKMTAKQLAERICQFYGLLPGVIQHQMFNLLDSHDVIRFYETPGISWEACRGAIILLFMLPGVPSVYYGDEILLGGSTKFTEGCRNPFDWEWNKKEEAIKTREFYQKLIALRKSSKALQQGGFRVISDEGYVFACARFTTEEVLFAICSMEEMDKEIEIPLSHFGIQKVLLTEDYLGTPISYEIDGQCMKLQCPAGKSLLLQIGS